MIFYGGIAVVTIALAAMVNHNRTRIVQNRITRQQALNVSCLFAIFLILFGVAALRIGVGNDYSNYVNTFHEVYVNGHVVTEPGFNLLVRLIYTLCGGECYLAVFAFFAFVTTFLFLAAIWQQSRHFTMSFFLFMTLGIYFRSFNTVRYYFVLAVTLYAIKYVLRREHVKFILVILIAALFHKSVLAVIPLYYLCTLNWKKWQLALAGLFCLSLFLFPEAYLKLALLLYPSYQGTVFLQTESGFSGNLTGIARCAAVLLLSLVCYREAIDHHRVNRFYFYLNLGALAIYLCASFLPLLSRFTYYLMTCHVLFVPGILACIEDTKKKKRITALVILFSILYFAVFLYTADNPGVRVLPYQTWINTEKVYLNGSDIF